MLQNWGLSENCFLEMDQVRSLDCIFFCVVDCLDVGAMALVGEIFFENGYVNFAHLITIYYDNHHLIKL